jgi:hypothetical protein
LEGAYVPAPSPPATSCETGHSPDLLAMRTSPPRLVAMCLPEGTLPTCQVPLIANVAALAGSLPWYTATSPPWDTATRWSSMPMPPSSVQFQRPTTGPPPRNWADLSKSSFCAVP